MDLSSPGSQTPLRGPAGCGGGWAWGWDRDVDPWGWMFLLLLMVRNELIGRVTEKNRTEKSSSYSFSLHCPTRTW